MILRAAIYGKLTVHFLTLVLGYDVCSWWRRFFTAYDFLHTVECMSCWTKSWTEHSRLGSEHVATAASISKNRLMRAYDCVSKAESYDCVSKAETLFCGRSGATTSRSRSIRQVSRPGSRKLRTALGLTCRRTSRSRSRLLGLTVRRGRAQACSRCDGCLVCWSGC